MFDVDFHRARDRASDFFGQLVGFFQQLFGDGIDGVGSLL